MWLEYYIRIIIRQKNRRFSEIPDLEKVRINTEILSVLYIQPEIWKVIIVYIYDLGFEGQPSRLSNLF